MSLNHYEFSVGRITREGIFEPIELMFPNSDEAAQIPRLLNNFPILSLGLRCATCCACPEGEKPNLEYTSVVDGGCVTLSIMCQCATLYLESCPDLLHNLRCSEGSSILLATKPSLPKSDGVADMAG